MIFFKYDDKKDMTVSFSFVVLQLTKCKFQIAPVAEVKTCDKEVREFVIFVSLDFVLLYRVSIFLNFVAPK